MDSNCGKYLAFENLKLFLANENFTLALGKSFANRGEIDFQKTRKRDRFAKERWLVLLFNLLTLFLLHNQLSELHAKAISNF